ncbi:hypothetical protein [Pseudalkalibacillus berkeleyi]|uniref:Uncharacterized protein n=1 Tax=Pseudalkalibacillus berkeleyi TaxID=1069813 RepID=A0ABS9H158_9BACL|nr:hypothetical protein [Pseudalkalibacillus berkeleyi]MCF6137631.1 hypothetical protein [Pseudalkalibacillus berkeleyi]
MKVTAIASEELEKSKSNSPEEFFSRSDVTFEDEGKHKTLSVLYVRYFDEQLLEQTSIQSNPVFEVNGKGMYIRDLVALLALKKNPEYRKRYRVYINEEDQFLSLFESVEQSALEEMVKQIHEHGYLEI